MDLIDFSDWDIRSEYMGSGRSEKLWLIQNEKLGLFKFPKSAQTTEPASEKLAQLLADELHIPCAKIDLGIYEGRIGSFSHLINESEKEETLLEGVHLISACYPNYDPLTLTCTDSNLHYGLDMIFASFDLLETILLNNGKDKPNASELEAYVHLSYIPALKRDFLSVLIFDALIGNTDRHQNNWALLARKEEDVLNLKRLAPLYDNGSSLGSYEQLDVIEARIRDRVWMHAQIETKSRSRIRVDQTQKREPTHKEVLEYMREAYAQFIPHTLLERIQALDEHAFHAMLEPFPDILIPPAKKNFIEQLLIGKRKLVLDVFQKEA